MEFLSFIWGIAEPGLWLVAFVSAAFVWLRDPVRRERTFGYIPTVLPAIFDRQTGKVLLCHLRARNGGDRDLWILPQGRILGAMINSVVEVLGREVGMCRGYKLLGSVMLGRVAMRGEYRLNRYMDPGEFTLSPFWRGKSYVAFLVEASEEHTQLKTDPYLYDESRWVSLEDAKDMLEGKCGAKGHRSDKVKIYMKLIEKLEKEMEGDSHGSAA